MNNRERIVYFLAVLFLSTFVHSCNTTNSDTKSSPEPPLQKYMLTTSVSPENAGSVDPENGEYEDGQQVEITAESSQGWRFLNWSGDLDGDENPVTVIMDSDKNITAEFDETIFPKTFGGFRIETGSSIIQTPDNGYIIVGNTDSEDGDFSDKNDNSRELYAIKTNSNGKKEWLKTYGVTTNNIYGESKIIRSSDSNYVLLAKKVIIKIDIDGNVIWKQDLTNGFGLTDITQTSDGGYAIIGGGGEIILLKTNSQGIEQWMKSFGGSDSESGYSIVEDSDGNLIFTGGTESNDGDFDGMNNGSLDIFLIKTDPNGDKIWAKTYGGFNLESGNSVTKISDGGYAITGKSSSSDGDFSDTNGEAFILKTNSDGNIDWLKQYSRDSGFTIIETQDNGFALAGQHSIYILKTDQSGNLQWSKSYSGGGVVYSLIQTSNENYAITGYTRINSGIFTDMNKGEWDIFLIKADSEGVMF